MRFSVGRPLQPKTVPKQAPRLCPKGHRQPARHPRSGRTLRVGDPCPVCAAEVERATRDERDAQARKRERDEWSRANPCPRELVMVVTSTGQRIVHSIPPHFRKRKTPSLRRRRAGKRRL